jgi:TRAP-type C4-dicarboxylate transport system substrate-binding protein
MAGTASNRLVRTLAGSAAAAGLILAAGPSHGQVVMKFATLTLNDVQHEYIKVYKEELEKATGGKIKVEVYPAGQLGGAPRQTEGLRLGTIEAAIGPSELFFGADPRFQVLAMAGLFKNNEHARKAIDVPAFRQPIVDFTGPRGVLLQSLHVYDQQLFAYKTPVTKLDDFKGKRTRVLAAEGEQAMVSALGGAPVPMSLPEVLPALQQGTIDGVSSVMHAWQVKRVQDDRKAWTDRGGKIVKLSPAEQAEAEKRVGAAVQTVLAKNPSSKELYDKLKAAAGTVN